MVFLDRKKAFDKVSRDALLSAPHRMGIEGELFNICKELTNRNNILRRNRDTKSNTYKQDTGI